MSNIPSYIDASQILDGKEVSTSLKASVKAIIDAIPTGVRKPKLATILVGENPASQTYVKNKIKSCNECGIISDHYDLPESTSEFELLNLIDRLNADSTVDGIMVQLSLPKHINSQKINDNISPEKDVDGFTPQNLGRMFIGENCFIPATPKGILEILKYYNIPTESKNVVVIGRSNIVGKPIASLLMSKPYNANVTVCHSKTSEEDLTQYLMDADIVIVAVGVPKFLTYCKPGAVLIDVGINRVDGKLVGDIDIEQCTWSPENEKSVRFTPVPGGVGPMTVASLIDNTLESYNRRVLV